MSRQNKLMHKYHKTLSALCIRYHADPDRKRKSRMNLFLNFISRSAYVNYKWRKPVLL